MDTDIMKNLPSELLFKIFQFLTQRNLFIRSRVCKRWQTLIVQPSLFFKIELQLKNQFEKLLQVAKYKTLHNKPTGHYIQYIQFTSLCICTDEQFIELIKAFS
ncbi:unnamed protein product [Cunninghamella blakesleeana]